MLCSQPTRLGDRDLVAASLQVQTAQHIGNLAAHLARVDRVAPQLGQRVRARLMALVWRRHAATSAWQQGTSTMALACFSSPKAIASSVAVSQACKAVTTSNCTGMKSARVDSATDILRNSMRSKPRLGGQFLRCLDQRRTCLDTVDPSLVQGLEIQVVKNEAQIGLARPMVGQRHGLPISGQLRQQRLNELIEVIDLLELAARILIEPALAREDMQGLEQLYALAGLEPQLLGNILRTCLGGLLQALLFRSWPSLPCLCLTMAAHRAAGADIQIQPTFDADLFQRFHIAFVNRFCLRKHFHRLVDAVFAQQMQDGIGRAVGAVGDIVHIRALKLELRMKRGDLQDTAQIQAPRPWRRPLRESH